MEGSELLWEASHEIRVQLVAPDAKPPTRAHDTDACFDLYAYTCPSLQVTEDSPGGPWVLPPGQRAVFHTGIKTALPKTFAAFIEPRSGLAVQGILLMGGVIDASYRGEWGVILHNLGPAPLTFKRGDRIAQVAVRKVESVSFTQVDELSPTARGTGGFGSTGR